MVGCCLLVLVWMAGSRDEREGGLEAGFCAYGSLYDVGGARGASGAAGMGSTSAPVVGGICWLCRRLWEEGARGTRFEAGRATGLAVLLGTMAAMLGSWGCGRASTGRR